MPRRGALSVIREHAGLVVFGFLLGDRGLTPLGSPTPAQALQCLHYLWNLDCHVEFWIADLLVWSTRRWGKTYTDMVAATGYDYDYLRSLKRVGSSVDVGRRRPGLSFSHHREVARLSPDQQDDVLARAERDGWTRQRVREEAYKLTHTVARPQRLTVDPCLHHGDCREILDRLSDRSVHLLLTDPPYGIDYESPTRILPFPHMADDSSERAARLLDEVLARVAQKLMPHSSLYIFTSSKTLVEMIQVVASHFTVLGVLPWTKDQWGVGDVEGNYGNQHELVIFAHHGPLRHRNGRCDARVLDFDRVGTNQLRHPAQKPVALLRDLIGTSSHEGDTVLDPFMGSGSTCVAARNAGRRYIGIEIAEQWYEVALQRLADPTSED